MPTFLLLLLAARRDRKAASRTWRARLLAAYRSVGVGSVALGIGLISAIVAAGQVSMNQTPGWPVVITATVLVAVHVTVRFPSLTASLLVLAVYGLLAVPVASMYAYAAHGEGADLMGASLGLVAAGLLAAIVAHRIPGRPWVALLLVLAGVLGMLPVVLFAVPALGLYAAYAAVAGVLVLRGGGAARLGDVVLGLRRGRGEFPPAGVGERFRLGEAGKRTAALLASDPVPGMEVLQVLSVQRSFLAGHLLLGTSGVAFVASEVRNGSVGMHPTGGLVHKGLPLAETLGLALIERDRVARALRVTGEAVPAVLVLHGATLPGGAVTVEVTDAGGRSAGSVLVVEPGALGGALVSVGEKRTAAAVARLARRAVLRLRALGVPAPVPAVPAVDAEPEPVVVAAS
jgi:hypothetical protein